MYGARASSCAVAFQRCRRGTAQVCKPKVLHPRSRLSSSIWCTASLIQFSRGLLEKCSRQGGGVQQAEVGLPPPAGQCRRGAGKLQQQGVSGPLAGKGSSPMTAAGTVLKISHRGWDGVISDRGAAQRPDSRQVPGLAGTAVVTWAPRRRSAHRAFPMRPKPVTRHREPPKLPGNCRIARATAPSAVRKALPRVSSSRGIVVHHREVSPKGNFSVACLPCPMYMCSASRSWPDRSPTGWGLGLAATLKGRTVPGSRQGQQDPWQSCPSSFWREDVGDPWRPPGLSKPFKRPACPSFAGTGPEYSCLWSYHLPSMFHPCAPLSMSPVIVFRLGRGVVRS